jgi:hypothetical protein
MLGHSPGTNKSQPSFINVTSGPSA